jgi:hypothetical protein
VVAELVKAIKIKAAGTGKLGTHFFRKNLVTQALRFFNFCLCTGKADVEFSLWCG